MGVLPFLLFLAAASAQQELPELVVDRDDVVIRRSCRVVITPGRVIADDEGDGVLQVRASGVTVEFAPGSVLRGAPPETPGDELRGIGVRVEGQEGVVLRGLRVHGFRAGVWATRADGLHVEDADLSGNFRQRLRSTPRAEAGEDWLYPHHNEDNQWLSQYGAALYLEDSRAALLSRIRVRNGQNGIVLDGVSASQVYDNDCSFLSGWGLALWKCEDNLVSRNAFDFCIRGYSHGVYNRGQDSAGILMFEQCSRNVFIENSATHGGDGFFGFAGAEALGEIGEHPSDWYRRRGCNDNLLLGNDFSYAAAHGVELTFSFGNRLIGNRLTSNAICGVWGGYSQDMLIAGNEIGENGEYGYGLERGGVNIEHGRGNRVSGNEFRGNKCAVHLWWDPDPGLAEKPWARANGIASEDNAVAGNRFTGDQQVFHFRGPSRVLLGGNAYADCARIVVAEPESVVVEDATLESSYGAPAEDLGVGETRPVGARARLRGRGHILMTEWGPWDHQEPFLQQVKDGPAEHVYRVLPAGAAWKLGERSGKVGWEVGGETVTVRAERPGLSAYQAVVEVGGRSLPVRGALLQAEWRLRVFPWTVDPREDLAGWRKEGKGPKSLEAAVPWPSFAFDHGGPSQLELSAEIRAAGLAADRFGVIATAKLPLPRGRYRFRTLSDDGVRLLAGGRPLIDNWTWHGPTWDEAIFEVEEASRTVELLLEHFEIDGYAKLILEIEILS